MTTLLINKELNGIEIIFGSKPTQEIIDSLKNSGFRWHKVKKLWYAKNTEERLAFAESIADGKTETVNTNVKKAESFPSLWERCKTETIPEHDRRTDTKTVAAETRKHIKQRFPEIRFSCRIGSSGWAAANEVNFYFKSAPFAKDSIYFEAVESYVKAWLWSFNYDNSDSMTDYFDRNFYENISDWDFEETKPTEAQKADLANFDMESKKAKEEEDNKFYKSLFLVSALFHMAQEKEKEKEDGKEHKYEVAMLCGGIMEDPDFHYEDCQIITAKSEKEVKEKYDKLNNCSYYYYGEVLRKIE